MHYPAECDPLICLSVDDSIGYLKLNRASKRNAINTQMANEFVQACKSLTQRNAKVCIIAAEGAVFCAGIDIADPNMTEAFKTFYDAMVATSILWIACVSAPVIGAGVAIVATAPIVIATPAMWVSLPELPKLGRFPVGVVEKAKQFVSHRWLMGIALSGERATAQQAALNGLVTEIVSAGEEEAAALKWAKRLAHLDMSVVSAARSCWLDAH